MAGAFELFLAYRFIKLLSSDFTEWDAYKQGIIDNEGKKIKSPKSAEEKSSWTKFEVVARNIKKLIARFVPFGKTKLGGAAAAAFLLKEELTAGQYEAVEQALIEHLKSLGISQEIIAESALQEGSDVLKKGMYQLNDPSEWGVGLTKNQDTFILTKDLKSTDNIMGIPLFDVRIHQANKSITVSKDTIRKVK